MFLLLNLTALQYSKLLGLVHPPTPLWNDLFLLPTEQAISMTIDNSSVFVPGGGPPQYGFRRGEFIAQVNGDHNAFNAASEVGTTVYHFSIQRDDSKPLNYSHEYQIVWIEPNDGTHVFGVNLGKSLTITSIENKTDYCHKNRIRFHKPDWPTPSVERS